MREDSMLFKLLKWASFERSVPDDTLAEDPTYSDRLKWAAEQGSKNLGEKFTTGDNMNKEAQTTLTYVLTVMGATFAYAFSGLQAPLNIFVAASLFMCVFYTALGIYLVVKTFRIGPFPSPYQEPKNLIKDPLVPLDEVLKAEIRAMQKRIAEAQTWITKKSKAVNLTRMALVFSPVVFAVVIALLAACACVR